MDKIISINDQSRAKTNRPETLNRYLDYKRNRKVRNNQVLSVLKLDCSTCRNRHRCNILNNIDYLKHYLSEPFGVILGSDKINETRLDIFRAEKKQWLEELEGARLKQSRCLSYKIYLFKKKKNSRLFNRKKITR